MNRLTFRSRKNIDGGFKVWYLVLDGKQVYGSLIFEVRDGVADVWIFKIRYENRKIPHLKNYYSTLKEAKVALVKYFNYVHDRDPPNVPDG